MSSEINKDKLQTTINPVEMLQKEALNRRQTYWLKKILRAFDLLKNPYEIGQFTDFKNLSDSDKLKCRFYYGDISHCYSSAADKYLYENLLKAFGIQELSAEKNIPLNDDCFLEQDFFREDSVSLAINSNKKGEAIPNDIFENAIAYFNNLAHVKWAQEFFQQLENFSEKETEKLILTGHTETLNEESILELAIFLFKLSNVYKLESIIDEISEKLVQEQTEVNFQTVFQGVILQLIKKDKIIQPRIIVDLTTLNKNDQQPHFSDSKTFAEIINNLSLANLQLSPRLERALLEDQNDYGYDPRYGNGYADFSRKITEQIGKTHKEIVENLFPNETVQSIKEKLASLPKQNITSPSGLVINMLQEIFLSESYLIDQEYQLNRNRSVKDGSCKDIETYWASAQEYQQNNSRQVLFNDGDFTVNDGYGPKVAILARDKKIFGITFPAGFLFHKNGNQISPLRPMFSCFNEIDAQDAFGWQYLEVKENLGYKTFPNISISQTIRRVFAGF